MQLLMLCASIFLEFYQIAKFIPWLNFVLVLNLARLFENDN